jgi:hypothetical protein
MELHRISRKAVLCVLAVLMPVSVWATAESRGFGERRKPPQEAFEACKDKSEGASVVITTPQGTTIKATCKSLDGQLVAVPEGPPPSAGNGGRDGIGN